MNVTAHKRFFVQSAILHDQSHDADNDHYYKITQLSSRSADFQFCMPYCHKEDTIRCQLFCEMLSNT